MESVVDSNNIRNIESSFDLSVLPKPHKAGTHERCVHGFGCTLPVPPLLALVAVLVILIVAVVARGSAIASF